MCAFLCNALTVLAKNSGFTRQSGRIPRFSRSSLQPLKQLLVFNRQIGRMPRLTHFKYPLLLVLAPCGLFFILLRTSGPGIVVMMNLAGANWRSCAWQSFNRFCRGCWQGSRLVFDTTKKELQEGHQKRTSGRPTADLHLANPSSCFFDAAWFVIFLLVFTCGGSLELQSKPTVRDSPNFYRFRTDDP